MMELLEQYEELIERDPSEISYSWKVAAVVASFFSSVSAYACSMLFSILWVEVCGGHCYFWSDIHYYKDLIEIEVSNASLDQKDFEFNWTEDIAVDHQSNFYCSCFHLACMVSCAVAVIFLMMFLICGKGGHDTTLFVAPWRLVLPALVGSLLMMIATMTAVNSFSRGYFHFSEKLYQLAYGITKHVDAPFKYNRPCEVFQKFTQSHNTANHDSCLIYWMIQLCSWTMTWAWIASFFISLLRILMTVDFNVLKVKVYALPAAGPQRDAILQTINEGKHSLTASHSPASNHVASSKPRRKRNYARKVL